MRWLRSLLAMALAAGITLLGAWMLMAWSDAGAPSLLAETQRHPMLGTALGLFSTLAVPALLQRRRRKSR